MTGRVWWVNQRRRDFIEETSRGIIWAPVASADGRQQPHWTRMTEVEQGDVVLHYHDGFIEALSLAKGPAVEAAHPTSDARWAEHGRQISLETTPLAVPVPKKDIPLATRQQFIGPAEPFNRNGDVKQGYLFEVAPQLMALIADLGGFSAPGSGNHAHPPANPPTYGAPTADPPLISVTADGSRVSVFRPEQRQLASFLFQGRPAAKCAFCGREFPRRFLVTAHLKPRSKATLSERADHSIVVAACALGCDVLYEVGAVVVDDQGIIRRGVDPQTDDLSAAVDNLVGRRVDPFGDSNSRYFAWHRRYFTPGNG